MSQFAQDLPLIKMIAAFFLAFGLFAVYLAWPEIEDWLSR